MSKDLLELLTGGSDIDELKRWVENELKNKKEPQKILDALSVTLTEVGDKYEKGDLFLSELMIIGYQARELAEQLKPYLTGQQVKPKGRIVIGTVRGDIHDIGKNIVIMMLQAEGWEVVDLGVDVPKEKFIEAVRSEKPTVLALSALLTSTMDEMKNVIKALKDLGLREDTKVIIGGRPVTKKISEEIGADGYADDSISAIRVFKEVVGGRTD